MTTRLAIGVAIYQFIHLPSVPLLSFYVMYLSLNFTIKTDSSILCARCRRTLLGLGGKHACKLKFTLQIVSIRIGLCVVGTRYVQYMVQERMRLNLKNQGPFHIGYCSAHAQ